MRLAALEVEGETACSAVAARSPAAREAVEQDPIVASPVRVQLAQLEAAFSAGEAGDRPPKLPRPVRALVLLSGATGSWALVGGAVWLAARLLRG